MSSADVLSALGLRSSWEELTSGQAASAAPAPTRHQRSRFITDPTPVPVEWDRVKLTVEGRVPQPSARALGRARRILSPFCPKALKACYRLVPAHGTDLFLAQADASDEEVDHFGGQCLRWWVRHASIGLHSVLRASPELAFTHLQLITKNVRPKTSPIITAVHRMRDPRSQNPAIRETEFVRDVVSTGTAARITNATPALRLAKTFVVLARRLRPAHRPEPTSQSRS